MYLSIFSPSPPASTVFLQSGHSVIYKLLNPLVRLIRHPLIAFVPQSTLVLALGWTLEPLLGLERTAFLQTAAFVVFNKVCTSQYFVWFIPLLPALIAEASDPVDTERPLAPSGHAPPEKASVAPKNTSMRLSGRKAVGLVSAWILGQAAWLGSAYRLELLALDAYLQVWAAGILLFGTSVYILGELLDFVDLRRPMVRVKVE
jgi:phosphatidylinositol glycan class M